MTFAAGEELGPCEVLAFLGMLRRTGRHVFVLLIVSVLARSWAQKAAVWRDPSSHKVQFATVDEKVKLEVLDWGGRGRPLVLLSGLGNTAHVFDDFASKLTPDYHVYGITRRGYGASSVPASGYAADRLGDDVLAVLDSLKLNKPVLVGHSIAGEELSSVGSRHPSRVAGLIYLDAGYSYAFDNGKGVGLEEIIKGAPQEPSPGPADLVSFSALQAWFGRVRGITFPVAEFRQTYDASPDGHLGKSRTPPSPPQAIIAGSQKYTKIPVPALAIFALPHDQGPWMEQNSDPAVKAFAVRVDAMMEDQVNAFESGVPTARIVRLPRANHYVFLSNEADVLREMRAFLATLK
jgi:pimeloyl-ACP methyl ester carboxylesterase